jgi:two-component system chemotaxis sensor kinase CheA
MNRKKLLDAALQNGFITREKGEALSDREVFNLALLSGISTSRFITDLSGRGLGLAIVAEKVNLLGGRLSIESEPGKGTAFFIRLPLRLATFRGILIRISDHYFLVPDNFIEKAIRINPDSLTSIEDQKTIMVTGVPVPVKHLGQLLDIPVRHAGKVNGGFEHALILASGDHRIAIMVDEILEEEEGIVKNPGGVLKSARRITGATILGNGRIVPILNVPDLLETSFGQRYAVPTGDAAKDEQEAESRQRHILVAEDSITARSLLRNILESSGFAVKTAVDGLEALMHLKNGEFDLVVSDVEMPNVNGFELITKIREDKRFSDMPVILVTALESAGDRQRGMDCGANAYIVKSNFEQSNLLEVIGRLI